MDDTIMQVFEVIRSGGVTAVFIWLWWYERLDRRSAEKRERAYLREAADIVGFEED